MKTMSQILAEVYDHGDTGKSRKFGLGHQLGKPLKPGHREIGKIGDHTVHEGKHKTGLHQFSVTDHEGKVTNILTTHKRQGHHQIDGAASSGHGPKQHELYHHLITKHDHILKTNEQTTGGHRIWKQLAKMRGVGIHGWDPKHKKAVNIDHKLRDDEETHHDRTHDKEHAHIARMELVAHKK